MPQPVSNAHPHDGLRAVELRFRYGRAGAEVGPLTFEVRPGQVWAVLGRNGAGKSTLFRVLAGELDPTAGAVDVGSVRLVPQGATIPGRLRVGEALEYLALLRGVPKAERGARVRQALSLVHMEDSVGRPVRTLSGGQQRRVVIAQALVTSPDVLLMDEPSAGLDLDQRSALRNAVATLSSSCALMISSHVVEDLVGLADHVLHLSGGRALFVGPVTDYLALSDENGSAAGAASPDVAGVEAWVRAYHAWNALAERATR